MSHLKKRKDNNNAAEVTSFKKKKKGNNGKWRVPKGDASDRPKANTIEPGDMGIWVTCPLHMKGKAAREVELLFNEYAEKMYGMKSRDACNESNAEDEDIEAAIRKEVETLKDRSKQEPGGVFAEVRIKEDCLLFMRCKAPIEPVEFSRRICQDAASVGHGGAKARYLNRLTPLTVITKASETALDEAARKALACHFKLKSASTGEATNSEATDKHIETKKSEMGRKAPPATYAIRPSIRSHNTLKKDDVIKHIADIIDPVHRVNLGAPDKVILVDIYQTICGLSVVSGDWENLKRYNLTELYKQSIEAKKGTAEAATRSIIKPQSTTWGGK